MCSKDRNNYKRSAYDLNRRKFLGMAAMGVGAVLIPYKSFGRDESENAGEISIESETKAKPDFCMFLANHWSYTGIGWSSGLASVEQSITDSLAMADYDPSVKTGINLDAAAYPMIAESNPDVIERLKRYLAQGKVEIIGGSYGQPLGSMVSGESNIRQLVVGQHTIQKVLGVTVTSFLEEEEFTHPQMPQILKSAGFRFASSAQCNTCGKHGSPPLDLNVFLWKGLDGTCIPTTPINGLVFHPPMVTHDMDWLWSPEGRNRLEELGHLGMPLAIKWVEFGWGPNELEGKTANKFFATKYKELSEEFTVKHTTLTEYLEKYGAQAKEPIQWRMDDFHKLAPWGSGGDCLRREGREIEAILTAAERFDAAKSLLGLAKGQEIDLASAWEHLLIAQSHDVSLCEDFLGYPIRDPRALQFLTNTGTKEENESVTTWGAMGYRYMAVARKISQQILDVALRSIVTAIDTTTESHGNTAAILFNSCCSERDAIISASTTSFKVNAGTGIVVRDSRGRQVPSQIVTLDQNSNTGTDSVIFQTRQLPPFGYATYYLDQVKSDIASPVSDLRTSDSGWKMENDFVSVELDAFNGAISRLFDRKRGIEMIDGKRGAFPVFSGPPNRKLGENSPEEYNSAQSKAEISWVERGPVRAIMKVVHVWPLMRFEHLIILQSGQPLVEVKIRVSAEVPPERTMERVNGWQPPLHILDGYWFSFASAFKPTDVIRDYPFGVESCGKDAIDTLNYLDVIGQQGGLLVVHSGTQYFKRSEDVIFSNLAMRDWTGIFQKPSWPRTSDYRFALVPHGKDFTNADRFRAIEQFDLQPICVLEGLHSGSLDKLRSFASIDSKGILLSAFRSVGNGAYEARIVEQDGVPASGQLNLDLPAERYAPCDLLGKALTPYKSLSKGVIKQSLTSWQIKTLRIENDNIPGQG